MMTGKRFALVLAAILALTALLPAHATGPKAAALTPAPEGTFAPVPAFVQHPTEIAANLTNTADDYDFPQALYFNGTTLSVIAVVETLGDYPPGLDDPRELWARVRIGETERFGGIVGLIPLAALSFDQTLVAVLPPEIAIAGDGPVDVMLDNGLSDETAGTLEPGAKAHLMGWLRGWAHISSGEVTGFVRHDQVAPSADLQEAMDDIMPPELDEIQPGYQQRYAEYDKRIMELYALHGDSNLWPLEVSAQASALAKEYGFLYTEEVNVMPGEGDLTEEQAVAKALAAAKELYGLDETGVSEVGTAFYHLPDAPDAPMWKINLWGGPGTMDVVVRLDRAGEVIGHFSPYSYSDETDWEAYEPDWESIEAYYYGMPGEPAEGDMTREQAVEKAFAAFLQVMPGAAREDYRLETDLFRDDTGARRWWLVRIIKPYTEEAEVWFMAALLLPEGEPM
ncbi:MAG TPA: hypothetical protein VLA21_07805, partial [Candidatus Limnocylindria bacterium]|nr:hypothetical protein [Candidatus Limnocylindria bacterium]